MKVLEFDGHPDNSRAKDSHKNVIYYFYFEISYKFSKIISSETDSVGPQLRVHRIYAPKQWNLTDLGSDCEERCTSLHNHYQDMPRHTSCYILFTDTAVQQVNTHSLLA